LLALAPVAACFLVPSLEKTTGVFSSPSVIAYLPPLSSLLYIQHNTKQSQLNFFPLGFMDHARRRASTNPNNNNTSSPKHNETQFVLSTPRGSSRSGRKAASQGPTMDGHATKNSPASNQKNKKHCEKISIVSEEKTWDSQFMIEFNVFRPSACTCYPPRVVTNRRAV
jgi:hypothetical protein